MEIHRRFFMLTLFFLSLFHYTGAKNTIANDEHEHIQVVHEIIVDYTESFLLSDATGNFRNSTAETFLDLFHENGHHVNFLNHSRNYLMETDLNTYIENMQELYQTHVLLRTSSDHEIIKFDNILNNYYEALVRVDNNLRIWPREDQEPDKQYFHEPALKVRFDILVQLNFDRDDFYIRSVQLTNPEIVNLTFRLVDSNRGAMPLQQTRFIIISEQENGHITRYRTSDHEGKITLSNVHRDDLILIKPPEDLKFIMEEEKTAGEWYNIPENDRLLYLKKKQTIDRLWEAFMTRSQIHISGLVGFGSRFTYRSNPSTNIAENSAIISRNMFSFHYSYRFLIKDKYELAAGLGASRTNLDLDTKIKGIEYEPLPFKDVDDHAFDLILSSAEIDESFKYESWGIPLSLTFRWFTGLPVIHSFDVTANITYNTNPDILLSAEYIKTVKGHYEEWNCTLENIPEYGFITNELTNYSGYVDGNNNHIGYGLNISANTPLLQYKLFLQTSLGYQRTPKLGNKNAYRSRNMIEYNPDLSYGFIPSMSVGTYDIGSFTAGFGFMYIF